MIESLILMKRKLQKPRSKKSREAFFIVDIIIDREFSPDNFCFLSSKTVFDVFLIRYDFVVCNIYCECIHKPLLGMQKLLPK